MERVSSKVKLIEIVLSPLSSYMELTAARKKHSQQVRCSNRQRFFPLKFNSYLFEFEFGTSEQIEEKNEYLENALLDRCSIKEK